MPHVSQQPRLDVVGGELPAEQLVVLSMDLTDRRLLSARHQASMAATSSAVIAGALAGVVGVKADPSSHGVRRSRSCQRRPTADDIGGEGPGRMPAFDRQIDVA